MSAPIHAHAAEAHAARSHSAHAHTHHVTSIPALFATFAALVALTVLTVGLNEVDLGRLDMVVVLGIATTKAALVILIFMQLMYDKLLNSVVLVGSVGFLALFLGSTLFDSLNYQQSVQDYMLLNPITAPVETPAAAAPAGEAAPAPAAAAPAAATPAAEEPAGTTPSASGPAAEAPATESPAGEAAPAG